jgi:hypothetical protein
MTTIAVVVVSILPQSTAGEAAPVKRHVDAAALLRVSRR